MMSKIASILAASALLFSCSNAPAEQQKPAAEVVATAPAHDHDAHEAIELNKGEKWPVDANMLVYIANMQSEVADFRGGTLPEYKALSGSLQKNADLLTSNCTMKGQAHDELHKWLLPYLDLIKEFANAPDEALAAKQFEAIKNSFVTFNRYFK